MYNRNIKKKKKREKGTEEIYETIIENFPNYCQMPNYSSGSSENTIQDKSLLNNYT